MSSDTGPKMPERHHLFCLGVLNELLLKKHSKYSAPFLEPVDWQGMGLPDYPEIITNPMDLATAEGKLRANKYASANDFAQDVRLIFENCFKYNPASGPIYKMGSKLQEAFESKWAQFFGTTPVNGKPGSAKPSQRRAPSTPLLTVLVSQDATEPSMESRKRKDSLPTQDAGSPPAKVSKSKSPSSISYTQKRELSNAILRLNEAKLTRVIDLIRHCMPKNFSVRMVDSHSFQ